MLLLLSLSVQAQKRVRPVYPVPQKTPEVERLLSSRIPWTGSPLTKSSLPQSVDNSKLKYFPPLIDQKGGSCAQASGIGYMFTYEINRLLDADASSGEGIQFSYLFTWNFLNGGRDEGGFVEQGLNIAAKYGIMTEDAYGYSSVYQFKWASGYEKYLEAMRWRVAEVYTFNAETAEDISLIKQYLYNKGDGSSHGGIVTFSTLSSNWRINNNYDGPSETGYHSLLTSLATEGAHALTIVGYDDTVEAVDDEGNKHYGAFIVVNSWGSYSHDNGRFYLPYYFFENRGEEITEIQLSSTMTGISVRQHEPQLVFKVRLDYSSRDDISLVYGASEETDSNYPENRFTPVIFSNQGGDYAMQGAYSENGELEFALDYTEHLPQPDTRYGKYFLNIICSQRGQKSGSGTIEYFSVMDYRAEDGPREYVCKEAGSVPLAWGSNLFAVTTQPVLVVSASPCRWKEGDVPSSNTFVVRTADGKYAKLKFIGYDRQTGKVTLQSLYQGDGSRNLTETGNE